MKTHHCPRCREILELVGDETIQLGQAGILTGIWSNILSGGLPVEIYVCPKCGKMEFFANVDKEEKIAKVNCSGCGNSYDADFPRCPKCGKKNSAVQ